MKAAMKAAMMKTAITFVVICVSIGAGLYAAQADPVMDAMQAELERSMTLTLNQLDKPYYLSYSVDDQHTWSASATLVWIWSADDIRSVTRPERTSSRWRIRSIERSRIVTWAPSPSAITAEL